MRDISERKQTEMELQKLASVVMHSSELINLANLDGKMTYLNDAGMKMLGISADEVAGIHITQVIPDHLLEKVQKEVLPAMMAGGWDGDLEYKNLRSGALTSVHANIFLVTDSQTGTPLYFANLSRDITGRKKAEEALRVSEQRLLGVAEAMNQLVWIVDAEGRSIYHNPQYVEYTGLKEATAEERWQNFHPEDRLPFQKTWPGIIGFGSAYQSACRIRRFSGEYHWFLVRGIAIRAADGTAVQWIGTATDIDDLKRAEQDLQDNLDVLAEAERIGHMGSWKMK